MKKDPLVYLDDIVESTHAILDYTKGVTFDQFLKDNEKQDAVLRRFTIIGEAAARIPQDFRDKYPALELTDAKGLRDVIVHDYDKIELDAIWKVVQDELVQFLEHVEDILRKEENSRALDPNL